MRKLFVANWKMNNTRLSTKEYFRDFIPAYSQSSLRPEVEIVFAPAYPLLQTLGELIEDLPQVYLGAQNVHWLTNGAHTGEVSVAMLQELKVSRVIVGHSERRQYYGEHDKAVSLRALAAISAGMECIVCIGETTYFENQNAETESIIRGQLQASLAGLGTEHCSRLVLAYEPVWAIGSGRAATVEIISRIHLLIRTELMKMFGTQGQQVPILYGGSTNSKNIQEIISTPEVNGVLVGNASLNPAEFLQMITK